MSGPASWTTSSIVHNGELISTQNVLWNLGDDLMSGPAQRPHAPLRKCQPSASMSSARRCSSGQALNVSGVGHSDASHPGQQALARVTPQQTVQEVRDAEKEAAAQATAGARRDESNSTHSCRAMPRDTASQSVPRQPSSRLGDHLCHGMNAQQTVGRDAATWRSLPATPAAFLPEPQLLETVFGQRVRRVSRETLKQVRRLEPGNDFKQAWHCFHGVLSKAVLGHFVETVNLNLRVEGKPTVGTDEFVRWIATFLLCCVIPKGHQGATAYATGYDCNAASHLVGLERFQDIKRSLTLTVQRGSEQVCRAAGLVAGCASAHPGRWFVIGCCRCDYQLAEGH